MGNKIGGEGREAPTGERAGPRAVGQAGTSPRVCLVLKRRALLSDRSSTLKVLFKEKYKAKNRTIFQRKFLNRKRQW